MSLRYVLLILELCLLFLFIMPLPVVCAGNIAGAAASSVLLILTYNSRQFISFLKKLWSVTAGRISLIAVALMIVAAIIYVCVLSVKMYRAQENKTADSKVVVVLGCQVKGTRPSKMLKRRLDAAIDLMNNDEDTICIVSGGQGWNEAISEAEAMQTYLIDNGISPDRVIAEDKSTNTYENLKFTRDILDERGLGRDITIATDGFHEYRASLIAKKLDFGDVSSCPAYTKFRYLPTYWVREWIGLTHFYIFGD